MATSAWHRYVAGLSRNTFLLALSSLFADISTEMLYPVLPIFLTAPLQPTSVGHLGDQASLQQAFDGFRLWGNIRGAAQVLAFFATVWALAVMFDLRRGWRCLV
jgi:hypothetical protein